MKKLVILLFILLLPSLVYLFLFSTESVYKPLPYFGPRQVSEENPEDTTYHRIHNFDMYHPAAGNSNFSEFDGKVKLVYFFRPEAEFEVPLTANLREKVQRPLLEHNKGSEELVYNNIALVGICVKQNWSKDEFNGYQMGLKRAPFWHLYGIDLSSEGKIIEKGFCIEEIPYSMLKDEGLPLYFLLDRENHVRGIFNARSVKETEHLQDAIAMLVAEEMVPLKRDKE